MISFENIVVRQRSNFIQFIYISFKNPRFISSAFINYNRYLFWCQSFLVMIPLMFVNYTLSSVWVAEWPRFEK